jgi:EmrB/QacA subfamily drug resistance transporter
LNFTDGGVPTLLFFTFLLSVSFFDYKEVLMQVVTNRSQVTAAMMVAIFLAAIEGTVVSTAMPRIVGDLGGLNLISWVYAAYLLTTTVSTPIYGKLADLFGRKIILVVGILIFIIGSGFSGMARTMDELIWLRAFQGLGAGAIFPITFAIVGDIYCFEERAKIQGLFSAIWGIAGILGPLVGGFFVQFISCRWIFYFNVPFGLTAVSMLWLCLHENFEKKHCRIDYGGAITFTLGTTALLMALLTGPESGWDSLLILGLFATAAAALLLFLLIESRTAEPMLPLKIFKIRVISVSNLVSFLLCMVLIGITAYIPMHLQGVLGYSATKSGLMMAPLSIAWTLGSIAGGRFMLRIGSRAVSLIGMAFVMTAALFLEMAGQNTANWTFLAVMALFGLGCGFTMTAFTVVAQSAVDWNMRGVVMASVSFLRSLGQTVGIVILGMCFNNRVVAFFAANDPSHTLNLQVMNDILKPDIALTMPASSVALLKQALSAGLEHIYGIMCMISLAAFAITFLLPAHEEARQLYKNGNQSQ